MHILMIDEKSENLASLRAMLDRCPGISEVNQAATLADAGKILAKSPIDVVFSDVASENFDHLLCYAPGHPELADYLERPLNEQSLLRSLLRIACNRNNPVAAAEAPRPQRHRIDLGSIVAVQARGNYSTVLCGTHKLYDRSSLLQWEKLLEVYGFTRLDRSTILRLDKVRFWTLRAKKAIITFTTTTLEAEIGNTAMKRLNSLIPPPHLSASLVTEVSSREPAHWKTPRRAPVARTSRKAG